LKIAVATNNYKNIVGHVGMCKGFILYDVKEGKILNRNEIVNPFNKVNDESKNKVHLPQHEEHHHHHNHSDLAEALINVEVLLCKKAGPGLINSMNGNGIKVFFTEEKFGDDAVLKLDNGTLEFIDPATK